MEKMAQLQHSGKARKALEGVRSLRWGKHLERAVLPLTSITDNSGARTRQREGPTALTTKTRC